MKGTTKHAKFVPASMGAGKKIATKLGKIGILPRDIDGEAFLSVEVTFEPFVYDVPGNVYTIVVGAMEARVQLEHPSYALHDQYQAKLDPAIWQVTQQKRTNSSAGVKATAAFGLNFWPFNAGMDASAEAGRERQREQLQAGHYMLISGTTDGWRIGGALGDPRVAEDVDQRRAGMLSGVYFKGKSGEVAEGPTNSKGHVFAGKLVYDGKGNSQEINAFLFVPERALRVDVYRNVDNLKMDDTSTLSDADELRRGLITACLAKAKRRGGGVPESINSEYLLAEDRKVVPKHLSKPKGPNR